MSVIGDAPSGTTKVTLGGAWVRAWTRAVEANRPTVLSRHACARANTEVHDDEPKQLALFLPRNDHELAAITKPLRDEPLRERPPARLSWMK